jgi:hypothetical protein
MGKASDHCQYEGGLLSESKDAHIPQVMTLQELLANLEGLPVAAIACLVQEN